MKKLFYSGAYLLFIGALCLSSCGTQDPEPDNPNPDNLVARAGSDKQVFTDELVELNGSTSTSQGSNTVAYAWTFASRPAGSQANIINSASVVAEFTPDVEGDYFAVLELRTVTSVARDTVKITAVRPAFILISESIFQDRRLQKYNTEGGPDYVVRGFLDIGAALTIDPGVVIHFERNAGFRVQGSGSLFARGTSNDSIIFTGTSATAGHWKGLLFDGSDNNINELSFCRISFGGSENFNADLGSANLAIASAFTPTRLKLKNTLIRNGQGRGISVDYRATDGRFTEFSNNAIRGNNGQAIRGTLKTLADIDATLQIQGNGQNVIDIFRPNSDPDAFTGEEMIWKKIPNNIPILMNLNVIVDAQLTIQPGVVLEFGNDKLMRVRDAGVLVAVGNADNRIVFTGIQKSRGHWKGLIFRDAASLLNELRFVTVEYAGSSNFADGPSRSNIFIESGFDKTRIRLANVISRESAGNGFQIEAPATVEILAFSNNQLTNNAQSGVVLQAKYIKHLDENSQYRQGNGNDYIEVRYYANVPELVTGDDNVWRKPADGSIYRMFDDILVDPGQIEIKPGVVMEFGIDKGLEIKGNGKIIAQGTANEKIKFSSIRKEAGSWKGVSINDSNSQLNVISHCQFEYAGSDEFYLRRGALHIYSLFGESKAEVNNSSFSNSTGFGIVVSKFSVVTPANFDTNAGNTFSNLSQGNVFIED